MATIQELEQKVDRLEREILAKDQKDTILIAKADKAIDFAKHAYKVDHYGYIWAWDVEKQDYRKTNMRVMMPEICDRALESRHISDNAIEGRHFQDDIIESRMIKDRTIEGRSIQDNAIGGEHIKDNSISGDPIGPGAIPEGKLANNAVSERNLQPNCVSKDKLSTDLISLIYSAGSHGYHLSDSFGSNEEIGINQNTLTEAINNLWKKIEDITGQTFLGFTWDIDPDYFVGEWPATIHISAFPTDSENILEHVVLSVNGEQVAEDFNVESFEYDVELSDTAEIRCDAQVLGVPYHRTKTVARYSSFWLGAGNSYSDVMIDANLIPAERGEYNRSTNGNYIFVIIGDTIKEKFIRADINGVEIPFLPAQELTVDGKKYWVFKSENTYTAATYNIDING